MMATIPLLPGLPDLAPIRKGRKRCAATLAHGWTRLAFLGPGSHPDLCDFLAFWYARVRQEGEHLALWGGAGQSPSRFVLTFSQLPFICLCQEQRPWEQAESLMMAVWLDDVVPGVRARLHQWVAPPYRHPKVSLVLGQAILGYLFDEMGLKLVEGRTPVGNRAGIRYALRLGFRPVATLPYGEWAWHPDGTTTITPVLQTQLTHDQWRVAHPSPYVVDERAAEGTHAWDPA